jgi:Protein of unknown function, DUF547
MTKKSLIAFILFSFVALNAQNQSIFFEQTNEFLKNNLTKEGKINYASIKKSPGGLFYILDNISNIKIDSSLEKESSIAFWINVYNLLIIKSVVENYPIKSVNLVDGFFEKKYLINGDNMSLKDIENNLNEIAQDPGIHFVLSKASNGDPVLYNGAYLPQSALYQITLQVKSAINKPNYIRVNKETNTVEFPLVFKEYKTDFVTTYFNEIDFVNIFLAKKLDNKMKIGYYEFDWSLNEK